MGAMRTTANAGRECGRRQRGIGRGGNDRGPTRGAGSRRAGIACLPLLIILAAAVPGDTAGRGQGRLRAAENRPAEFTSKDREIAMPGLERALGSLPSQVLPHGEQAARAEMLRADLRLRREEATRRDREAWNAIQSRADWDRFRDRRVSALRRSLGEFPDPPAHVEAQVGRVAVGNGYRVEALAFPSREGFVVTANLYVPSPLPAKMPVLLLIHSHHNPRFQGELQDMGALWARSGCLVLVPDLIGYGERRGHQSGSRQEYRYRYVSGLQLLLAGDSLMGWMVWDLQRCLDVALARRGADPERVAVLGSVAGGGDPAAVLAALDSRVTCVAPFNFGGPQPETEFPLPEDAETRFNYLGSAYWETTRNLAFSGRDGFLPWTIVGAVAPRALIYAHEFQWDRERDPVWKRLQRIWSFYGAADRLGFAHGAGLLRGTPPEATHCNNIGEFHRRGIHPLLQRWFGIPLPEERQDRRPPEELHALTPHVLARVGRRPAREVYLAVADARAREASRVLNELSAGRRVRRLRERWALRLGGMGTGDAPAAERSGETDVEGITVERWILRPERTIQAPVLLLRPRPAGAPGATPVSRTRVVVAFCQEGKEALLLGRTEEIAGLLRRGITVCLPDLRGTGETRPAGARGFQSEASSLAASEWMLGRTLLGARLADLRSVLRWLRARPDVDPHGVALWGDSFALPNPPDFRDPLIGEGDAPRGSEPLGGLLALLGGLFEPDVRAILARGALTSFRSVLEAPYCYVPYDVIVPGALAEGDLGPIVAALAPRPVRLERLVDGRNQLVGAGSVPGTHGPARRGAVEVSVERGRADEWLVDRLKDGS